ncbi:metal-dependent hydrolase [Bacillus sp. CGMCC 1.16541]|uniref:metal-dependent hydrolase n=1 Tax=Bacillus sp. CGMCC 1.16541 TaxID=2185143 RepID=UPI000D72D020|nr:metal-dependent hydrolase [Bacillus sp. CGMCC 1.16541]
MQYRTHIVTSVAAGAGIATTTDISFTFPYVIGIAIGALIPDIDEPNSFIGRRSFGLSKLIKTAFGHRGITHSVLACFLFVLLYQKYPSNFTLGIAVGYAFHIVGDFFSKRGVPLFSPLFKKKLRSPLTYETGGTQETILFYIGIAALIYFLYEYQLYMQLLS